MSLGRHIQNNQRILCSRIWGGTHRQNQGKLIHITGSLTVRRDLGPTTSRRPQEKKERKSKRVTKPERLKFSDRLNGPKALNDPRNLMHVHRRVEVTSEVNQRRRQRAGAGVSGYGNHCVHHTGDKLHGAATKLTPASSPLQTP